MQMIDHDVIIVGGGPTGLMLAGELALARVDVAIVERRVNQEVDGSRASGLHSRSLEILDQRGIVERFVSQGTKHTGVPIAGIVLDGSDRSTRHNYTLALRQEQIEQELAGWIADLEIKIYYGCNLTSFVQDAAWVTATLNCGRIIRAKYLVGCDGGRSTVRKTAGIEFIGWEPTVSSLIFEADMAQDAPVGMHYGERGTCALGRLEDGKRVRGVIAEQTLELGDAPNGDQLRTALMAAYGSDFGIHNISWLSRFTDAARQAVTYRSGRVLLAGDAAHVHSPVGGQGLSIGIQDAMNLGWKLAQVCNDVSPDSLLDTYHAERHPVGADLLERTLALSALSRGDDRTNALRRLLAKAMEDNAALDRYVAAISGLDIRYDLGSDYPLVGSRMPDLDLLIAERPTRLFELLHDARPVLLNFSPSICSAGEGWTDRVKLVEARFDGRFELPVVGSIPLPSAVLIRPDGYVAWAGNGNQMGLPEALTAWFGTRRGRAKSNEISRCAD